MVVLRSSAFRFLSARDPSAWLARRTPTDLDRRRKGLFVHDLSLVCTRWMEEAEGVLPGLFVDAESWRPVLLCVRRGCAQPSGEVARPRSAWPYRWRAKIPHRALFRPAAFDRSDFGARSRRSDFPARAG